MLITLSLSRIHSTRILIEPRPTPRARAPLDYRGKSSLQIELEFNRYARFHPKTDNILKTVGSRISLAVYSPQLIYPEITKAEFKKIVDDINMSEK